MPRYEQRNPAPKPRRMTPPPASSGKDKPPANPPRQVPKPGQPGYVPGTGTGGLREIDPDTGELRRPAVPRKPDSKPTRPPGGRG